MPQVELILDPLKQATIAKDMQSLQHIIAQTDTILSQLKSKGLNLDFWYPALQSFKAHCQQILHGVQNDFSSSMQVRDQQMALNLAWLAQVKYPNKKIIVWAASYHIIKDKLEHLRHLTMGHYFTQKPQFAKKTYVLGFASYAGSAGAVHAKPYEFTSSQKESLEEWINEKQHDFVFVDFNAFTKIHPHYNETFFMGGVRHLQQQADWTKSFDGVFYIRRMYPCSLKK